MENFVFGLIGKQDLNLGGDTFVPTLPDGSTPTFDKIGSHTFLDGLRNVLQNGCVGNGTSDDRNALNTLANTTLQPNGGMIYFAAPYTYRISSNLTFPANVALLFAPGSVITIDSGVVLTILGTVFAPLSQIFIGVGLVVYGNGATRNPKNSRIASAVSVAPDSYLIKPGDADVSIVVPSFSTVRSIRLVIAEDHPINGLTTTYAIKNSDGTKTYISQAITDGDTAMTNEVDTELTLPHVTGVDKTVLLNATGTDTTRFKGWVEVEHY